MARRDRATLGRPVSFDPTLEPLEPRRLLAVLINEYGGSTAVINPAEITTGSDGNLWFTEANPTASAIGRATPSGAIETFTAGLSSGASPEGIAPGSDGALWFAESDTDKIGRIDTSGNITEFSLPTANADPEMITPGPDGALWFTERDSNQIGRITTSGQVNEYPIPTANSQPLGIALGPDGALWFTESAGDKIGRISITGKVTEFSAGITPKAQPTGITTGSDGNLWFTEPAIDRVARITSGGFVTEFSAGITAGSEPDGIAPGPDGRLWFTEEGDGKVGAITTAGVVQEYTDAAIRPGDGLTGITPGPDGNLWFTALNGDHVDRISIVGSISQFPASDALTSGAYPLGIAPGPDDALWFTEPEGNQVGRIDISGAITEFSNGIPANAAPQGIALGPVPTVGGSPSLWFTEPGTDQIGEITTAGTVTQFGGLAVGAGPGAITLGPDGNLWFCETSLSVSASGIAEITPAGVVTEFPFKLGSGFVPQGIVDGPGNALWFTLQTPTGGDIGRITTAGQYSFFPIPNDTARGYQGDPIGIVAGHNNDLWFTDTGNHAIGEITAAGVVTEYNAGLGDLDIPDGIAAGSDGNFWFTDPSDTADPVGQITPKGVITLYQTPTPNAATSGITAGPDGNIWFAESAANQIGQVVLPGSINPPNGYPATFFASLPTSILLATFADVSGATNATNFTATVDYGDGTVGPATIVPVPSIPGKFNVVGFHTYQAVGIYTAKVTIGTAAGNLAPLPVQFNVISPIQVSGLGVDGIVGRRSNTLVAMVTDADGSAVAADFTATISWADGTTSTGFVYPVAGSEGINEFAVYAGHVFASAGSDVNSITVVDRRNMLSGSGTSTATITSAPTPASINEFGPNTLTPGAGATAITLGPDDALWFTEANSGFIGRIDPSGAVTEFVPTGTITGGNGFTPGSEPTGITLGPDGALWFTESATSRIGRVTTAGTFEEFSSGITPGSVPDSIVAGQDGNLWFTEVNGNQIGRITPQGNVTEFNVGLPAGYEPDSITLGSDGNLWFVGRNSGLVGRITPAGVITLFSGATSSGFTSITSGPDGNLWFTESAGDKIGQIVPTTGQVTEFTGPAITSPGTIAPGPDGNLYYTDNGNTLLGQIATDGFSSSFGDGITANSDLGGIAAGPDGNVYFTEIAGDRIGQFVLPGSIINAQGTSVTVVATIPASFVIATFSDNSTGTSAANFTATIDFGDGIHDVGTIEAVSGSAGSYEVVADHTYEAVGTFTALVTIGTEAGTITHVASSIDAISPISAEFLAFDGIAGRRSNTLIATFNDVDTSAIATNFSTTVAWGDGTTSTALVVLLSQSSGGETFAVYAGHTYAFASSYAAYLTITDVRNLISVAGPSEATIAAAAPFTAFNEVGPGSLTPGSTPDGITLGPDGALWFTETGGDRIGRIDIAGSVNEYGPIPPQAGAANQPTGITLGPDGALWFTNTGSDSIGRLTAAGVFTIYDVGISSGAGPNAITLGPDGNLWFTEGEGDRIGRITPKGVVTEFSTGLPAGYDPVSIAAGPDGALWFVGGGSNLIGRISTSGLITTHAGASGDSLTSITKGPDGDLWFTDAGAELVGKISPVTFQVTEYGDPSIQSPAAITTGPDGKLYFTIDAAAPLVEQVTTSGVITPLGVGLTANSFPAGIVAGPDGNVYFAEMAGDRIGQLILPQTSVRGLTGATVEASSGKTFSGLVGSFTDSSPIATPANFDAVIHWGDGTSSDVVLTSGDFGRFTVSGTHTYAYGGVYTGTIGIFNAAGSKLAPFTADVSSQVEITSTPFSIPANRTFVTTVANFSLGLSTGNPSFVATIHWGDGTTSAGVPVILSKGVRVGDAGEVEGAHDYAAPGTYQVTTTIQVVGEPGNVASSTAPATVTSAVLDGYPVAIQPTAGVAFGGVVANVIDTSVIRGINPADYVASINWGDGTPTVLGKVISSGRDGLQVAGIHVYQRIGDFPVTVLVLKQSTLDAVEVISSAVVTSAVVTPPPPPPSFVVTNTNDSGPGSLRQAIINADLAGGHLISFAIPTLGVATIAPASPLPLILGPTVLDGQTQDVFEGVAPPFPLIQVDGQLAGAGVVDGLAFGGASAGSLLLGVSVFGFSGAQVEVEAADVTLYANFLGLQADGTVPIPLGGGYPQESFANRGVEVVGPGAIIGGPLPGQGDVISGNDGWGILIDGAPALYTQVVGDRIGLDPSGSSSRPNLLDGVAIVGNANHEFVGPGNTISGNVNNGVLVLGGSSILIDGDDIGTDGTGSRAVGNGDYGVDVDGGSLGVLVGGSGPFMADVVSGNAVVGVGVRGESSGVTIESDEIGTDVDGKAAVANGIAGVLLLDSPGNVVGPGDLVSGNGTASAGAGIWLDGPGSMFDQVIGDLVGTDATGQFPLPNEVVGVLIDQASGDVVGGTSFGSSNVISGNASVGLMIAGPGASGNLVAGNLIGTNIRGAVSIGNGSTSGGAGVYIDDAANNSIGGPNVPGNLISGNNDDGVQVFGPGSSGNLFQGNGIGTDLTGMRKLGNAQDGLVINGAPGTRVVANLIAGNALDGITVSGPGASTLIQGNSIGQGLGGQALGNGAFGVLVINGAPSPTQAGNTNVNNGEGAVRDTNLAAPSVVAESLAPAASSKKVTGVVHGEATPRGSRDLLPKAKARPSQSPAKSP